MLMIQTKWDFLPLENFRNKEITSLKNSESHNFFGCEIYYLYTKQKIWK